MRFERFAVLGSNSFAGAALVARLVNDGAEVIGFNRSPVPLFGSLDFESMDGNS